MVQLDEELDLLLDPRAKQRKLAAHIKTLSDIEFPELDYWNYEPCSFHDKPDPVCVYKACGGSLFKHQRTGATWLYVARRGILADQTGLGKTNIIVALCALLKQRGQLTDRAVIFCQAPAVMQWVREIHRWTPMMEVEAAVGNRSERVQRYMGSWDVLVVGYQMALSDADILGRLDIGMVVSDDVDPLRNHDTKTARLFERLSAEAERVYILNATPLQTKLQELHSLCLPLGGFETFGSINAFERRYVRQEPYLKRIKGGQTRQMWQTIGYKHMNEFKDKFEPYVLRRRYEDVDDVTMPTVAPPENVWLELHPAQRAKYTELQKGVLKVKREEGTTVKHAAALAKFTYGRQICAGLPAIGEADGPEASVKLDWLMGKLGGDWTSNKVVVFSQYKGTVSALQRRCAQSDIGIASVWGETNTAAKRDAEQDRFWQDPSCRVLVGTSSIERSLNLQISNIVVNIDMLLNPARMTQILGRIKRAGSKHSSVFVFNLLCVDTQEERYLDILERRQALSDFVLSEENDLFESLSPMEMLTLIQP